MASLVSLFVLIIPVALIALIFFIVFAVRSENTGGEDVVKKVYIYLVLFVTLMMIIGGSVGTFMALADIIAPTTYLQSFEEYSRWQTDPEMRYGEGEQGTELSEEELREDYESLIKGEEERSRQRALNNLIKSFGWIIIPLPVFIYFQRRLKNENDS